MCLFVCMWAYHKYWKYSLIHCRRERTERLIRLSFIYLYIHFMSYTITMKTEAEGEIPSADDTMIPKRSGQANLR